VPDLVVPLQLASGFVIGVDELVAGSMTLTVALVRMVKEGSVMYEAEGTM
jgi:hypothetical protein